METYIVVRRAAWRTEEELRDASVRATLAAEQLHDEVAWIRTYVVEECDCSLGTISVYQASSPEAIRAHGQKAGLPLDEIVLVSDTVIARDDPVAAIT